MWVCTIWAVTPLSKIQDERCPCKLKEKFAPDNLLREEFVTNVVSFGLVLIQHSNDLLALIRPE